MPARYHPYNYLTDPWNFGKTWKVGFQRPWGSNDDELVAAATQHVHALFINRAIGFRKGAVPVAASATGISKEVLSRVLRGDDLLQFTHLSKLQRKYGAAVLPDAALIDEAAQHALNTAVPNPQVFTGGPIMGHLPPLVPANVLSALTAPQRTAYERSVFHLADEAGLTADWSLTPNIAVTIDPENARVGFVYGWIEDNGARVAWFPVDRWLQEAARTGVFDVDGHFITYYDVIDDKERPISVYALHLLADVTPEDEWEYAVLPCTITWDSDTPSLNVDVEDPVRWWLDHTGRESAADD